MNAIEALKKKLSGREKIYSSMLCFIQSPTLPGLYKSAGVDFLVLDMEHGAFCPENVGDFLDVCIRDELPVIARVQDCQYAYISKSLDMGCDGILIPRTETMEQVETAIRAMRVHPLGMKGIGGRAFFRRGESLDDFNKNRLLFLQIESAQGASLLDEILQRHGDQIAGILIGPSDMSVSLGAALNTNDVRVVEQIKKTIDVCEKYEKSVGMFMSEQKIAEWEKAGMNIFWVGSESYMMYRGLTCIRDTIFP